MNESFLFNAFFAYQLVLVFMNANVCVSVLTRPWSETAGSADCEFDVHRVKGSEQGTFLRLARNLSTTTYQKV